MATVINVFTINDGEECSAKRRSSETPTIGPTEVSSAVVTSADDHRTTGHGIDELSDILSNARSSLKPGSTFFTASQMAKNSSRA
ncbi:hypothetical protein I7F13_11910 [Sinorhizobium meliloti]|uniref:hypothetical protein n=1 Tax=Rhizobium meliloti TaxID=382 RepID=UPI0013E3413D|nr:hypothetical protein [Sinorhizobium meliloti]MDE3823061.1 hypothetical protein [Sinorhizobium meliloti]